MNETEPTLQSSGETTYTGSRSAADTPTSVSSTTTSATTTKTNKAMDKELEQLCEELELAEGKERSIFRLGFTLGFMEGMIAGPPPHRPSCKFPDAETR